eukprot:73750-Prorocentrum_minimum.AAC.2
MCVHMCHRWQSAAAQGIDLPPGDSDCATKSTKSMQDPIDLLLAFEADAGWSREILLTRRTNRTAELFEAELRAAAAAATGGRDAIVDLGWGGTVFALDSRSVATPVDVKHSQPMNIVSRLCSLTAPFSRCCSHDWLRCGDTCASLAVTAPPRTSSTSWHLRWMPVGENVPAGH